MRNNNTIKSIILLSVFCFLFSFNICSAKILPEPTNCSNGVCDYTLNDIVSILPIIAKFILSIVGSLALLAFVYGGVMFLISAGSTEKITKAKGIITSAFVGLIIVFASYAIIGFIFKAMGIGDVGWFESGWFQ